MSLIIDWFILLCTAVRYIHERRLLHRDLKSRYMCAMEGCGEKFEHGVERCGIWEGVWVDVGVCGSMWGWEDGDMGVGEMGMWESWDMGMGECRPSVFPLQNFPFSVS